MITLSWPWVLFCLPLPWIIRYALKPSTTNDNEMVLHVPFLEDFDYVNQHTLQKKFGQKLLYATLTLLWLSLILSAARPMWYGNPMALPTTGRDLMLAVDLSESMSMEDFVIKNKAIDRLTATKAVAADFINQREGDRIGLILFGEKPYIQAPLTYDRTTVNQLLQESAIGLAGQRTAIGDAIGLAIKRFQIEKTQSRVLILLTDGANTAGEITPLKAAEIAKSYGLKIYTIGIGADEMLVRSFFGNRKVNPSLDLDEDTLQEIAEKTGGQYFRATDTKALQAIYQEINKLEPIQHETQHFRPQKSLFMWPLGLALLLALGISFSILTIRIKEYAAQ